MKFRFLHAAELRLEYGDYDGAIDILNRLHHSAEALNLLAQAHQLRCEDDDDLEQARDYYRLALTQGSADAAYGLAMLYIIGSLSMRNRFLSQRYFAIARRLGCEQMDFEF